MQSNPLHTLSLHFATVEIFENYVIVTSKEGNTFGEANFSVLEAIFKEYFGNNPFGYISNRKFEYEIATNMYKKMGAIKNLVGLAIWCHSPKSYNKAEFEKTLFKKPFLPFHSKEECERFIKKLLK